MLFLWLNKTPPKWNSPLSVQEGFKISILKYYFLALLNIIRYQFEISNWKSFLNKVVLRSFCFGLIFSPPLAWIAKNGVIRALEVLSSSLVINKCVKNIPKTKSFCLVLMFSPPRTESSLERRRWMSYGVEAFLSSPKTPISFQYTYDLVWNRLENILVIAYERDMIKGI